MHLFLKRADVAPIPKEANPADRFSKLIRAIADQESEAALAVFFSHSVTTITNWCKGQKPPKDRDMEELARKCGISSDELRSTDERTWQAALSRVLSKKRVIITPGWLLLVDQIRFMETNAQCHTFFVITADAYNDTQRRDVQEAVKNNMMRGINYVYIIPDICQYERSLIRFTESANSQAASNGGTGTTKILKTPATKNAAHQWKRIDHVMLLTHGGAVSRIERFADIPLAHINEGYEQLYKASDQPYADFAWKALSIREIDYYKELLEEWSEPARHEGTSDS
jgi:hypothetical protein